MYMICEQSLHPWVTLLLTVKCMYFEVCTSWLWVWLWDLQTIIITGISVTSITFGNTIGVYDAILGKIQNSKSRTAKTRFPVLTILTILCILALLDMLTFIVIMLISQWIILYWACMVTRRPVMGLHRPHRHWCLANTEQEWLLVRCCNTPRASSWDSRCTE